MARLIIYLEEKTAYNATLTEFLENDSILNTILEKIDNLDLYTEDPFKYIPNFFYYDVLTSRTYCINQFTVTRFLEKDFFYVLGNQRIDTDLSSYYFQKFILNNVLYFASTIPDFLNIEGYNKTYSLIDKKSLEFNFRLACNIKNINLFEFFSFEYPDTLINAFENIKIQNNEFIQFVKKVYFEKFNIELNSKWFNKKKPKINFLNLNFLSFDEINNLEYKIINIHNENFVIFYRSYISHYEVYMQNFYKKSTKEEFIKANGLDVIASNFDKSIKFIFEDKFLNKGIFNMEKVENVENYIILNEITYKNMNFLKEKIESIHSEE